MKEKLLSQMARVIDLLERIDPGSEEYHRAVEDADVLFWLAKANLEKGERDSRPSQSEEVSVVHEPEPTPAPEPEHAETTETTMSKVDVIDILSKLSSEKNVNVNAIMKQVCGVAKLSQVPPEKYEALVKAAREAADATS